MDGLIAALRSYQQADEDGVMVLVSRQACDQAADELSRLRDDIAPMLETENDVLRHTPRFSDLASDQIDSLRSGIREAIKAARNDAFEALSEAYMRGADWMRENPDSYEYLPKAASDYADKTTSER